jgi:hypothetical protein
MKLMKNILRAPIRNTIVFFVVSLIAYFVFALTSLYLSRVMCASSLDIIDSCRGTNLEMFFSIIVNDLELIFRLATELSVVVIVSQALYRLATRRSK